MRTIFNYLGPLTNPARADVQLIGAPSATAAELMANALMRLPVQRALVVHGSDGLDEITTTGLTIAFDVSRGEVQQRSLMPMEFGLPLASLTDLAGGDAQDNAALARAISPARRDRIATSSLPTPVRPFTSPDAPPRFSKARNSPPLRSIPAPRGQSWKRSLSSPAPPRSQPRLNRPPRC